MAVIKRCNNLTCIQYEFSKNQRRYVIIFIYDGKNVKMYIRKSGKVNQLLTRSDEHIFDGIKKTGINTLLIKQLQKGLPLKFNTIDEALSFASQITTVSNFPKIFKFENAKA